MIDKQFRREEHHLRSEAFKAYAQSHPELSPRQAAGEFYLLRWQAAKKIQSSLGDFDASSYGRWHLFVGGTLPPDANKKDDLPAPLPSLVGFYQDIMEGREPDLHPASSGTYSLSDAAGTWPQRPARSIRLTELRPSRRRLAEPVR